MPKADQQIVFSDRISEARARLEQKGFAVIDAGDAERESLLSWASQFGRVQNHPKAAADGIVDLVTDRSKADGAYDRSRASVQSEFLPHSDGAFVDGFWVENGLTRQIGPPSLFLLQCVKAAEVGGESLIIDGQAIFDDLRRESPELLARLRQPNLSFGGGKDYSLNKSVFERISSDRWRVRFRSDLLMVEQSARSAVLMFYQECVLNPKYHQLFTLKPGQILVADNFRLLHGRKEIELKEGSHRHVRRLWIWDSGNQTRYVTLQGDAQPAGAFPSMAGYAPLTPEAAGTTPLALGIRG